MTIHRLALAGFALMALASPLCAQTYPDRPITMIVPFAAGGASDVIARIIGERMGQELGQTIVNENVAGAGGVIALNRVAAARPDGYTILIGNTGTNAASYVLTPDVKFTPESFAPVGLIAKTAPVLAVKKDFPAKTLSEFVAYAKANPGKLNYGSAGAGSATHLACVLFGQQTGTDIVHVPYRGTGPALNDLVAGTLDFMCDQGLNMMGQYKGSTVKVLAVAQASRFTGLPEIPTSAEAGLPGFEVTAATAMYAPAGLPPAVGTKLVNAMAAAYKDADLRKRIEDLASEVPGAGQNTPEALGAFTQKEASRWTDAIRKGNIKAQ